MIVLSFKSLWVVPGCSCRERSCRLLALLIKYQNGLRKFQFAFRLNYVYFVLEVFHVVFGCVNLSSASKLSNLVVAWFCLFSVVSV